MTDASRSGISPAGQHTLVTDLDEPPPGRVLELCAACVRFVLTKYKVELDFTADTLPMVDHYVEEAREAIAARPETMALTAHAVGAYLGEVVRRHHACWWRIDHDDPGAWRLEFRDVLLTFYPVQVAYTAITRDDEDAALSEFELPQADRDALFERLAQLPPVSEDEYFAPSTKVEVLDIAVDALLARRARDPDGTRSFGPDDYAGTR
jgi:hypothetical protein